MKTLCKTIKLRLDPKNRPGLLGVICNDTTYWIHHVGVRDFIQDLVTWSEYVDKNPSYQGLPSSQSFRPCVTAIDGLISDDDIYEFSADAVRAAMPLIINTWKIFNLSDPMLVARTDYLIRQLAVDEMASRGDVKLSLNHIVIGLLRYGLVAENSKQNFPEGVDFGPTLQHANLLETLLKNSNLSSRKLEQELTSRLPKREGYEMEENMLVMFEPDVQDFYSRLEKLASSEHPSAIQFLVALLQEPSSEFVAALSAFQVTPKLLRKEAERFLPKTGWRRFLG